LIVNEIAGITRKSTTCMESLSWVAAQRMCDFSLKNEGYTFCQRLFVSNAKNFLKRKKLFAEHN